MGNITYLPTANDANQLSTQEGSKKKQNSKGYSIREDLRQWKRCKRCEEVLPIKKFYHHQGKCIDCISEMNKLKRQEIKPI